MKSLATIRFSNFDTQSHSPAHNIGKVRFSCDAETGQRNCYIGVHPLFFIAAYLNPHTIKALKKIMVTNPYQELRGLILDMMIQVALKKETQKIADRTRQGDNKDHTPVVCSPGRAKSQLDFAFEGLYDSNDSESEEEEDEDASNENSI